mgnify:CR=1 FL=1|jgi:hypothetical protein
MNMLYDSESFSVVHVGSLPNDADGPDPAEASAPQMPRHAFEIVDKRSGKELFLEGAWAELFQERLADWERRTPTREEVENTLDGYASLAQNPLIVH